MKALSIFFYGLAAGAAVWWSVTFVGANTHLRWFVIPDGLAQSGLFIAVLFVMQGIRQFAAKVFEPRLLIEVLMSLSLFAGSAYLHMFPAWSGFLGGLHILSVLAIASMALFRKNSA